MAGSMYSGGMNLGGVQGFQQGYDFATKAERAEQEARARGEELKQKMMQTKLKEAAFQDAMGEPTMEQQEIQSLKQQVNKHNTNTSRKTVNEAARQPTAKERDATLSSIKTRFKTDPEIYKALGVKNPDTMGVLNPMDGRDRKWMADTLARQGVTPESMGVTPDSPEWKEVIDKSIDGYPAIKADGATIDLLGLSAATGAASMANPEHNKIMEENLRKLRKNIDAISKTRSDNMVSAMSGSDEYTELPDSQEGLVNPTEVSPIVEGEDAMDEPVLSEEKQYDETMEDDNRQNATVEEMMQYGGMTREEAEAFLAEKSATKDVTAIDLADSTADEDILAFTDYHENGGTRSYTAVNPKTGAYGRYQFMPKTMSALQKRLGLPQTKKPTPEEQDAMYAELVKEHKRDLASIGVPATAENVYALHQLGGPTGKEYLKGNITPKVVSYMKNQFPASATKGKSDADIVNMWENRFTKTGKSRVATTVDGEMRQQAQTGQAGQPLSDMRMRKIYALIGAPYPKDPNEPTAKIKNYEYLRGLVGDDKAFDAVFGSNNSTVGKTELDKLYMALDKARADGNTHRVNQIEQMIQNTIDSKAATKTKIQYDRAMKKRRDLEQKGEENWDDKDKDDYRIATQTIEEYEDPASIQASNEKQKQTNEAEQLVEQHKEYLDEFYKTGKDIPKEAEKDLKSAQNKLYAVAPNKTIAQDAKIVEDMEAYQEAAVMIDDTLKRIESGDLAPMEKGVIDNTLQYLETKIPSEIVPEDRKKVIEANIRAGTQLGYLQAMLIKAISGTAASDSERQNLTRVMQGDDWDQPEALKIALDEFRDGLVKRQTIKRKQLKVSPYDAYRLSRMDARVLDKGEKKVVRRGKTKDGRTVVQYDDGTTEVL